MYNLSVALKPDEAWRQAIARFGMPPFALTDWAGPRRVKAWSGATFDAVAEITLEHGRARVDTEDPFVWVQTSVDGPDDLLPDDEWIREGLTNILWPTVNEPPELSPAVQQVDLVVARRRATFQLVQEGFAWCAFRWLDKLAITVTARGVPLSAVELAPALERDFLPRDSA